MKTKCILHSILYALIGGTILIGCMNEDLEDSNPTNDPVESGTYLLNEGSWGSNNANITYFNPTEKVGKLSDMYASNNGNSKLGDVANAMLEEDGNIYVLLNGSKYVARLDLQTKEQARYTFPEGEGEPRCMDVKDNYVYITQYGGQVTKLNSKDMTLAGTFKGGANLEGIVVKDGKLYVANSYIQEGSGNFVYFKEVFVIDAKTLTLESKIDVVDNPTKLYEIGNKIYLISQGNYDDVPGALQVIDTQKGTSKVILNDVTKITKGLEDMIYGIRSTFDANRQPINSFFIYNEKTETTYETSYLQDAPSSLNSTAIYLLERDEKLGFIYVGTTDYQHTGTIYQFDKNGKLIQSFDSGGINPSTMLFID